MLSVTCPSCGAALKVPDTMAGKKGKCPKCHASIPLADILPAPATQLEVFSESQTDPDPSPAPADAATPQDWYYSADGQEFGPVPMEELLTLIEQGKLKNDHFVWKEGMTEWTVVSSMPELSPAPAKRPAEPPAASQEQPTDPLASLSQATNAPAEPPIPAAVPPVQVRSEAPAPLRSAAPAVSSAGGYRPASSAAVGGLGDAFSAYIEAFAQLFKHPIRLALITIVYVVLTLLAVQSMIGIILLPVFVMGYVTCVSRTVTGEKPSMADFIGFMRHGWDSLWHLMMLLAGFFVTLAAVLAPVILLLLALYALLSTIGILAGSSELMRWLSSPDSLVHRLMSNATGDATGAFLVAQIILGAVIVIVGTPLAAGTILLFFLALDVASTTTPSEDKFSLVYNALGRMFRIAAEQWALLLCCGALMSVGMAIAIAIPSTLIHGLAKAEMVRLATWCMGVLLPVIVLAYQLHVNVFAALMAARIRAKVDAAA